MSNATQSNCQFCQCPIGLHCPSCPHCGQPSRFPNVIAAAQDTERQALAQRYEEAKSQAAHRQADHVLDQFEMEINRRSKAVLNRSLAEVERLANSHTKLHSGYYRNLKAGNILPDPDSKWDTMRLPVDDKLFPYYREDIFFAALTLNEVGLAHYGDCSVVLREDRIAHRASVFEENSVVFMDTRKIGVTEDLPAGYRAVWSERGRLSVAKLADQLNKNSQPAEFSAVLLKSGTGMGADDAFVEVHIYGSMSVYTMEKVSVKKPRKNSRAQIFKGFQENLERYGVSLELR